MQNAVVAVAITIRGVPDQTRDELAARAAASGTSLQQYLLRHLIELAEMPDNASILARARERVRRTGQGLTAEQILEYKNDERRR
jgi:plasmid stability protein